MRDADIAILKSIWSKHPDGRWGIDGLKSLTLKPRADCGADYFAFDSEMEMMCR
jgi:hypothetical protein